MARGPELVCCGGVASRRRCVAVWIGALLASLPACADGPRHLEARGGVSLEIAPLDLPGIADAIWDLEVDNGASPPERVWAARLTSSRHGDGAGSASYIGPCDAEPGVNSNTITVHLRGIYAAPLTPSGVGDFGSPAPPGGEAFEDPGALRRTFVCLEGRDTAARFDISLMRPADQGFFDVAVNFNQIYCSAKFDCCDMDGDPQGDNGTCEASEYRRLLFNGAQRDRTYLLGFACSVGDGARYNTTLMLDDLVLTCDGSAGGPAAGTYTLNTDPARPPGNQGAVPAAHLFEWASYRGEELVSETISKAYWNLALGVGDMAGCVLTTSGTADDLANTGDHVGVSGPLIEANTTYPVIHWEVDLASCTEHPLGATPSVLVSYTPTVHEGVSFAHRWIPGAPVLPALSCGGESCPALPGYDLTCNAQGRCEYAAQDASGWRARDSWIWVPAASFLMGAPESEASSLARERPVHEVDIAEGYFIQKYELTVAAYEACELDGACSAPSVVDGSAYGWGLNRSANGRSDHPQNGVTWQQAREFCAWVAPDGRLPSEAEWELAASGESHHRYPWGDTPEPTCGNERAVMDEGGAGGSGYGCGAGGTWPVGAKGEGVSAVGALDMVGNLWEWTEDCWHSSYLGAPADGSPWLADCDCNSWVSDCSTATDRVLRSAAFDYPGSLLRAANRVGITEGYRYATYGARCVRGL